MNADEKTFNFKKQQIFGFSSFFLICVDAHLQYHNMYSKHPVRKIKTFQVFLYIYSCKARRDYCKCSSISLYLTKLLSHSVINHLYRHLSNFLFNSNVQDPILEVFFLFHFLVLREKFDCRCTGIRLFQPPEPAAEPGI